LIPYIAHDSLSGNRWATNNVVAQMMEGVDKFRSLCGIFDLRKI